MFRMLKTASLMMLGIICGSVDAENYSTKAWDYVATFNGFYSNRQRVREGDTKHTIINAIATPVSVPCLGSGPMMMLEVGERDVIEFRQIFVPSDGQDNILMLTPYNITGWNTSRFGQFNMDVLQNLTKDDLSTDPTCVIGLEVIAPGVFFGEWPVCTHVVNGTHPSWGVSFTCNHTSLAIPMSGDEVRDLVPYDNKRFGLKFPLINPPPGYVNPCERKLCLCDKN